MPYQADPSRYNQMQYRFVEKVACSFRRYRLGCGITLVLTTH